MRPHGTVLLALLACSGKTEPSYPPFDGPAPTVSDFAVGDGVAMAILRDSEGASTIGRTDYTYVYFYKEGSSESQVSFAPAWTWSRVDDLTWRVTVPGLVQNWAASAWHVADDESNVQGYLCGIADHCQAVEDPLPPSS
jgi:hypothetical protein